MSLNTKKGKHNLSCVQKDILNLDSSPKTSSVVTIVLLLFPTLFGKRVFSPFPLLWVILSPLIFILSLLFTLFHHLNRSYILISFDNPLIIYVFRSKVLVRRNQCLLAQTHRTLTKSPILLT